MFHFQLVCVFFIHICKIYVYLSEDWFLQISVGVTVPDMLLKNDLWIGKIYGLYFCKLYSYKIEWKLVWYDFDLS